jgi:hypothetical protein
VLIGGATVLGLVVVALAALVVIPRLTPKPVAPSPAFVPVATATRVAANLAAPTSVLAAGVQATAVPTPTVAPKQPTSTPPARPTVGVSPKSLLDVRFAAGPAEGWVDNPPFAAWSDGAYRLQATRPASFVAVGVPIDRVLGDIVVSATFRKTGGPPGGGYGLIVRDQGPPPRDGVNQEANAYVMETGDLGEFGIWRRDGDHWVDLVPWMRANSIRPGGSPNDLSVRAVGDQLTFSVNGVQLASVKDGTLLAGGVGLFVGGDYNEVALDRFSLSPAD